MAGEYRRLIENKDLGGEGPACVMVDQANATSTGKNRDLDETRGPTGGKRKYVNAKKIAGNEQKIRVTSGERDFRDGRKDKRDRTREQEKQRVKGASCSSCGFRKWRSQGRK